MVQSEDVAHIHAIQVYTESSSISRNNTGVPNQGEFPYGQNFRILEGIGTTDWET